MFADNNPFATQLKMMAHVDRLADWQRTGDAFPVLMEINPTNYCNEACDWCISQDVHLGNTRMTGNERTLQIVKLDAHSAISNHPERRRGIALPDLTRFLSQAQAMGLKAVNWSGGGEPTGYAHFRDAVEYCAGLGLEQGLLTNGLFPAAHVRVIGERLRWTRVSLDTIDSRRYEAHKHTRGFDRVMENIQQLVKYPVQLVVNMNVAGWNFDEIEPMAHWAKDIGADAIQIRPILGLPFSAPGNDPYRRQPDRDWLREATSSLRAAERMKSDVFDVIVSWDKFEDLDRGDFGRSYTRCLYHFFTCVLNANGDLCVCMYHLDDHRFTFGNIYLNSAEEIWHSGQRQEAVSLCGNSLDLSTCQVCCKGHEINKFMQVVEAAGRRADANFL